MSLIDDMNRNDTNLLDGVESLQQTNRITVESIEKATRMSVIQEIPQLVHFLNSLAKVILLNDTVVDSLKRETLLQSEQLKTVVDLITDVETENN